MVSRWVLRSVWPSKVLRWSIGDAIGPWNAIQIKTAGSLSEATASLGFQLPKCFRRLYPLDPFGLNAEDHCQILSAKVWDNPRCCHGHVCRLILMILFDVVCRVIVHLNVHSSVFVYIYNLYILCNYCIIIYLNLFVCVCVAFTSMHNANAWRGHVSIYSCAELADVHDDPSI